MNIITRKKEIMEVIEKLNEATKLANGALTGLEELESSIESQQVFNQDTIVVDGVEYVKTDKEVKVGDYIVFEKDIMSMTKANTPYPIVYDNTYQTHYADANGEKYILELHAWAEKHKVEYTVFTKKSLTRKEVIEQAKQYINKHLSSDNFFTFDDNRAYVTCEACITHSREKRTSTLIIKGYISGSIGHKETIQCHPEDAYNETIGKAILIARANKDEEMKELFENAPQPTEIKEGMYIDILVDNILVFEKDFLVRHYDGKKDVVQGSDRYGQHDREIGGIKQDGFVVKDDSDVIY